MQSPFWPRPQISINHLPGAKCSLRKLMPDLFRDAALRPGTMDPTSMYAEGGPSGQMHVVTSICSRRKG